MRGLSLEQARVRVAHQLLLLSEKFGPVIPQTRAVLAELAGTTVETAIRISNAMARDGVIVTRRGQIEVLCNASLRAYAEGREPVEACAGS
jgi:CRP-like cAMP-binding protein